MATSGRDDTTSRSPLYPSREPENWIRRCLEVGYNNSNSGQVSPPGNDERGTHRLVALGLGEGLKQESECVIRSFAQINGKPYPVGIQMDVSTFCYQYG